MARLPRIVVRNRAHLIRQRSEQDVTIFHDDHMCGKYLDIVASQLGQYKVRVLAYCLMPKSVCMVLVPRREEDLAKLLGQTHRQYSMHYKSKTGWDDGKLFKTRFESCPMDKTFVRAAISYVERIPVRAGVVDEAWDFRWSSAHYRVGPREADPILDPNPRELVDVDDWKHMLVEDLDGVSDLAHRISTGKPCGERAFIRKLERDFGIPLMTYRVGRPRTYRKHLR